MAIKLITIDLDGTLLNDEKQISERNRRTIMAAEDQGVMIVISSGRCSPPVWGFSRMAGIRHSPVISNNGPRVQAPDGSTIAEDCLEPETAREVMRRWDTIGLFYILYNNDVMYYSYRPDDYQRYIDDDARVGVTMEHIFDGDGRFETGAEHVHKIVCFDSDPERIAKARELLADMGDVLEVNSSWWNNVEIMRKGIDKGWAVDRLREHYGLERDEVMAFGDADNDREMLLHAGWPVAMQNGTESMKRIARIIAPDCNDSGVGRVIEEYVLSGRIK